LCDEFGSDETSKISNQELVSLQKQKFEQQEGMLDTLSTIVVRQEEIGRQISSETDKHIKILDQMETQIDGTTHGMERESNRIRQFSNEHGTTALWIIILVLVIAIVLVVLI